MFFKLFFQFERLPFVRSLFFRYGLTFTDAQLPAVLTTDANGAVSVSIGLGRDRTARRNLIFHYNLRLYDGESTNVDGQCLKAEFFGGAKYLRSLIFCCLIFSALLCNLRLLIVLIFAFTYVICVCLPSVCQMLDIKNVYYLQCLLQAPSTQPLLFDVFANLVSASQYLSGSAIKFKSICKFKVNDSFCFLLKITNFICRLFVHIST